MSDDGDDAETVEEFVEYWQTQSGLLAGTAETIRTELDELLETTVSYGTVGSGGVDAGTAAYTASLASVVDLGSVGTGLPLDGAGTAAVGEIILGSATPAPLAGGTDYGLRVDWRLPTDVGNGVQSDRYEFALGFYGEQARHNDP